MVKIYVLINPVTKEVFYVGATKGDLSVRLKCHIRDAFSESWVRPGTNKHCRRKLIHKLVKSAAAPIIQKMFECERIKSKEMEQTVYQLFHKNGIRLLQDGNKFYSHSHTISKSKS